MLPLAVRVEDLERKTSVHHIFSSSPVHIGRNDLNDLPLAYPFVSMWHGMLRFDEFSVEYADLNSTNGSEVDGHQVKKNVFIPVGEKTNLRIGNLRLHISRRSESFAPEPTRSTTQFQMRKSVLGPLSPFPVAAPAPSPVPITAKTPSPAPITAKTPSPVPIATPAPSPRPIVAEKPPPPAAVPEEDRFRAIGDQLFPVYTQYRQGWRAVVELLVQKLEEVPASQKAPVLESLVQRMSALQQEEQFRSLAARAGVPLRTGKVPGPEEAMTHIVFPPAAKSEESEAQRPAVSQRMRVGPAPSQIPGKYSPSSDSTADVGATALSLLRLFAQTYGSKAQSLRSSGEVELLLNQMAAVLETFSKAFVELRRGVDQFVEEMSVHTATTINPLRKTANPNEVLRHLLDAPSERESERRLKALTSGFAQVMIHQVALLSGIREGIRALLARFSPEQLEQRHSGDVAVLGNIGALVRLPFRYIFRKLWPFRVFVLWRQYRRVYLELEEEQQLQSVVFGTEFAHAYVMMVSGRPPDDRSGPVSRQAK